MNMDRFEKGPREILNPEIQKVRVKPARQPAFNEIKHLCHPISGDATALHPQAHPSLPWVLWVVNFYVVVSPQDLLVLEEQEVQTVKDTQLFYFITTKWASTHVVLIFQGSVNFKFGVLYAKEGQLTDDEMFSNGKFLSDSMQPHWSS